MREGSAKLRRDDAVKIYFDLEVDESGYPPVSSEYLWCLPTDGNSYLVDNIPFYVREISMGDEITAKCSSEGVLVFRDVVHSSSNSTVRVFVKRHEAEERVRSELEKLGCKTEKMQSMPLLAVSISSQCGPQEIFQFLDLEASLGNIAFEESSVRYQ